MSKNMRILLFETPLFAHYVNRAFCQNMSGVDVVGVASDTENALDLIEIHKPDVLIVNFHKDSLDGFNALETIHAVYPNLLVIGRIKEIRSEFVLMAIEFGVMGFINDHAQFSELIEAIETIKQGYPYFPKNVLRQFLQGLQSQYATAN